MRLHSDSLPSSPVKVSLPLMRKTFIEAGRLRRRRLRRMSSLPLMRKTFIEAEGLLPGFSHSIPKSLPLMRKTFIEATTRKNMRLMMWRVSSAYAEDFH